MGVDNEPNTRLAPLRALTWVSQKQDVGVSFPESVAYTFVEALFSENAQTSQTPHLNLKHVSLK